MGSFEEDFEEVEFSPEKFPTVTRTGFWQRVKLSGTGLAFVLRSKEVLREPKRL